MWISKKEHLELKKELILETFILVLLVNGAKIHGNYYAVSVNKYGVNIIKYGVEHH